MEREFYVISFESTHHAIMMEKKLKEKYKIDMIPTPREITASCGQSIRFSPEILEDILKELENKDMKDGNMGIYKIIKSGESRRAKKMEWG